MKYANPSVGVYLSGTGKIFILRKKDGPYPLADEDGEISLYVFEDETGSYPKTVIKEPFTATRLGSF